jgi:hypothetical protein
VLPIKRMLEDIGCHIGTGNNSEKTQAREMETKARRALATELLRRWKRYRWWHSERALTATKQLLVCANFFFQYVMDLTETACVCALLLRTRQVQHKKRHWVHPILSNRLLNGQFYKLYEDLRNCRGKFFNYFRMSTQSFDKLLGFVGPRITHENTQLRLSVPPQERLAVTMR